MRLTNLYAWFSLLPVLVAALGCTHHPEAGPREVLHATAEPLVEVDWRELDLHANEGLMYQGNTPFTGIAVRQDANGVLSEKITYQNGSKEGLRQKWFADGTLAYQAHYQNNRLHGEVKSWWANGALRSLAQYQQGKANGTQKQWYSSGQLFKELNLVDGQEQGMQRAWRETGKLFVNYEARNGRIFGLKRAGLCYELQDEIVIISE
ncbi:MAG: toxin-antitoxin system YwqK family antitoxin [Bacteroidota bacterium]